MIERLEILRQIKSKNSLSKEDKKIIIDATKEFFGEDFTPRKNCSNCWIDQLTILILKLKNEIKRESGEFILRYKLKEGVRDFKWAGIEFSKFTLTNENAETLAKFNPTAFKKFLEEVNAEPVREKDVREKNLNFIKEIKKQKKERGNETPFETLINQ